MSEIMTNKAQGALGNYGEGKERENSSDVMGLSGAHIIDLMHAASFASFKGNRRRIKGSVLTKYREGSEVTGMKTCSPIRRRWEGVVLLLADNTTYLTASLVPLSSHIRSSHLFIIILKGCRIIWRFAGLGLFCSPSVPDSESEYFSVYDWICCFIPSLSHFNYHHPLLFRKHYTGN